jgi:hypothetical protein
MNRRGKMLDLRIKNEDIGYLRLLIDLARIDETKDSKRKNLTNESEQNKLIYRNLALFNLYL